MKACMTIYDRAKSSSLAVCAATAAIFSNSSGLRVWGRLQGDYFRLFKASSSWKTWGTRFRDVVLVLYMGFGYYRCLKRFYKPRFKRQAPKTLTHCRIPKGPVPQACPQNDRSVNSTTCPQRCKAHSLGLRVSGASDHVIGPIGKPRAKNKEGDL